MTRRKTERIELGLHTTMSENTSVITPRAAIETAVAMGHSAVAVTDQNTVQSFPEVARCQERYGNGIKVIYGAEILYQKNGNTYGVALLAKNTRGIHNLYRIVSSIRNGVADWQAIAENRSELLCGAVSWLPWEIEEAAESAKAIAFYDYIALAPVTDMAEQAKQWQLYTRAKQQRIPVVAAGNCHYVTAEDQICKQILDSVKGRETEKEITYFRTTEEMLQAFSYMGERVAFEMVITAPNRIANGIEPAEPMETSDDKVLLPDAYQTVCVLCKEKLETRYGKQPPRQIAERLNWELSVLEPRKAASLLLLTYQMTKALHDREEETGCRGTVGSTLMAYLLDISNVNPLPAHYYCRECKHTEFVPEMPSGYDLPQKTCPHCGAVMCGDGHNIPCETAIGLSGEELLRVDINVQQTSQEDAVKFLTEQLGRDRVAYAGTVPQLLQRKAEQYCARYGGELSQEDQKRVVEKLISVKIGEGHMPFGVVLLPRDMQWEDVTPVRHLKAPVCGINKVTHMQYHQIEKILLKLNVLTYGLCDRLTQLYQATGTTPADVDFGDPKVYALFKNLDTCGISEFSSEFCKGILSQVDTLGFSELVKISGMSHGTDVWCNNAETLVREQPFQSLIGTRDDIILTLQQYGVDRETAYFTMCAVRKGIFRRENPQNRKLTQMLEKAGVPQWYIDSMKKIQYLFPKAHATVYVKQAVTLAWFKVYYPDHFYKITMQGMCTDDLLCHSDEELRQMLTELDELDRINRERIELVLEARNRGYIR